MLTFFYLLIFIFGLLVGSFLNCLIYRLETGGSFLKGRSFCPRCKHILNWQDLIPIFSFLILKRKCRYCGKKISWQYPLVELVTAILFVLIFFHSSTSPGLVITSPGLVGVILIMAESTFGWGQEDFFETKSIISGLA